jgi:sugar/nucleoside kinase (ribokinase family)
MEYIVTGTWFVNDINFAGGEKIQGIMGGSGLFAYCGMLQYTEKALFLGAVGNDAEKWFGPWMNSNNIARDGLVYYNKPTTLATMYYESNGEWHEDFQHGPLELGFDINYFSSPVMRDKMNEILSRGKAKGLYVSAGMGSDVLVYLMNMREKYGFKLMLELFTQECIPEFTDQFAEKILPHLDIYSLNQPESFSFFSVKTEDAAVKKIMELEKPCFYRVGEKGSYMIKNGEAAFMSAGHLVPRENEVDATGCGNCSTAAAHWAFCEGYAPKQIASIANIAAAYNVLQHGPYLQFDGPARKKALSLALELAAE